MFDVSSLTNASPLNTAQSLVSSLSKGTQTRLRQTNAIPFDKNNWNKSLTYSFAIKGTTADRKVSLRIPPSSITISSPFATAVTATNRGILEENNGFVFRNISIKGTTGIWANRRTQGKSPSWINALAAFLPDTVTAVGALANQAKSFVSSITGSKDTGVILTDSELLTTGYVQFWDLHNLFVEYVELKKKKENQKGTLVFSSPKDGAGYVCTPSAFDWGKDKDRPLFYNYSIVLKAWGLVNPDSHVFEIPQIPKPSNVAFFKAVANTINEARDTITSASNVLSGVQSDLVSVMNVYTQGTLVVKEFAGLVENIRDFDDILHNNSDVLLVGSTNSMIRAMKNAFSSERESKVAHIDFKDAEEGQSVFPSGTTLGALKSASNTDYTRSSTTPGGEDRTIPNSRRDLATSALGDAFNDPTFLATPLSDLNLPPSVEEQINSRREDARNTTSGQIRELVLDLKSVSDNLAQSVGMMDATYAQTFLLPAPVTGKTPTEDDILIAAALENGRNGFRALLGTGETFRETNPDPFVSANENLQDDDQVTSPGSSIPIVFPRGSTLEQIAQRYLGDANRAREIAILNQLRAPYIDEIGFTQSVTGIDGRIFVINNLENITINQYITLNGTGVTSTRRRILNLEDIGGGQFRATVDGPDNLSVYAGTSPYLRTRLPGTIGSNDIVLIPNEDLPDNSIVTRPTPLYTRLSQAEKVFKIDMSLNEDGTDLAVDASGDIKRSFGYNNATQAIRLAVETEKGELEQHTDYGMAIPIGSRNSDITTDDLTKLVESRITADPRFASADVSTLIDGNVVKIEVIATGAAGTGAIPVEFEIGRA